MFNIFAIIPWVDDSALQLEKTNWTNGTRTVIM